ncbi:MAG: hypothetical protein IIT36_00575 [Aeriscardovia sp.]|nr:hypothetical protein [Aeriscardovia sp.]
MGYVPERITDYPQEIDDRPLHIDAEKLAQAVEQYYEDPIGVKVALAIATFADSRGLAFPSIQRLSDMTGYTWSEVSKAVGRLQALGILTIKRRRFTNSKHSHNEYRFRKDFVHQVADKCSSHFLPNVQKWKAKAKDVAAAVVRHASETVVNTVSDMASKIAAVVQTHPEKEGEFLSHPEKAAAMALDKPALSSASASTDPASLEENNTPVAVESVQESAASVSVQDWEPFDNTTQPMQWEDGSQHVQETVKQETNLETLPANTVSAVGSANTTNTQPMQNVQTNMANAPKFINGEVDSRWETQQLLHEMNPAVYPAW